MAGEFGAERTDRIRQHAAREGMGLRERSALGVRGRPDRSIEPLGELYPGLPGLAARDVSAIDKHRVAAAIDALGKLADACGIRGDAGGDGAVDVDVPHRLVPVVEWPGEEDRTTRRLHGS